MADVQRKAEAEAEKKGLSGNAERAYVGGVFNRIKQAHASATAPGKGARHLKRAARKEARQEAKNRVTRHEQLAAQEKLRMRSRVQREEPRAKKQEEPSEYTQGEYRAALARHDYEAAVRWGKHISPAAQADAQRMLDASKKGKRKAARSPVERAQHDAHPNAGEIARQAAAEAPRTPPAKPAARKRVNHDEQARKILTSDLRPIRQVDREINLSQPPDPDFLKAVYGQEQLPKALDLFSHAQLRAGAKAAGVSAGGSRQQIIARMIAHAQGKPAAPPAAPPAAQPADESRVWGRPAPSAEDEYKRLEKEATQAQRALDRARNRGESPDRIAKLHRIMIETSRLRDASARNLALARQMSAK